MLGAIIGDVAGSSYEHAVIRLRSKEQSLFPRDSRFTDDTVMTCAIACAMMDYLDSGRTADLHELCVERMREWGAKYPDAGYGGRFRQWLKSEDPQPYNSYGNGSAMRVSPVAWLSRSLEETEKLAKMTAEVTHNHPDADSPANPVMRRI